MKKGMTTNCLTTKQNFLLAKCLQDFLTQGKKFGGREALAAACIRVLNFKITPSNVENVATASELDIHTLLKRSSSVSPLAQLFRRLDSLEQRFDALLKKLGEDEEDQKKLF